MHILRSILAVLLGVMFGCADRGPPVEITEIVNAAAPAPQVAKSSLTGRISRAGWDQLDLEKLASFDPAASDLEARIPKEVRKLDGQYLRIRCFMIPTYSMDGLTWFIAARKGNCLFGHDAIWHFLKVTLRDGETASYVLHPIDLDGWFRVKGLRVDDQWVELYHLDNATIVPR